jgi:hypothetical protein
LEDSEDCRGAGGHGNQHVRLRSAQIDCNETICPALAALCCFEPWQTSGSGFQDITSRNHAGLKFRGPQISPAALGLLKASTPVRLLAEEAFTRSPPESDITAGAPRPALRLILNSGIMRCDSSPPAPAL